MVGSRKHASWGALAAGPARCVGDWLLFRQLPEEQQRLSLIGMRGAEQMRRDIDDALLVDWLQQRDPAPIAWMGAFTRFEILIAVRGCTEHTVLFFEVGDRGRLYRVSSEATVVAECVFQRIRIVGMCDRTWHVDPDPDSITEDPEWRLWAWESRPLARLQWDPGEWQWRDPLVAADRPPTPFFQYSARLGRHILLAQRQTEPAAAEHWRRQGLRQAF